MIIIQVSWIAYSSKLDDDRNKLIEIIQVFWMMMIQLSFAHNRLRFNFAIQESAIIASDFWMTWSNLVVSLLSKILYLSAINGT